MTTFEPFETAPGKRLTWKLQPGAGTKYLKHPYQRISKSKPLKWQTLKGFYIIVNLTLGYFNYLSSYFTCYS